MADERKVEAGGGKRRGITEYTLVGVYFQLDELEMILRDPHSALSTSVAKSLAQVVAMKGDIRRRICEARP